MLLFSAAAAGNLAQAQSGLAKLPILLADQYRTVRSVVLARRDCVEFEYYKAGVNSRTLLPVHSVTKSVLSILVGIALDKGYLRVDQKLSELLPEALDPTFDAHVRDITVRDFLTMTSGFDSAAPFGAKAVIPPDEMWQWTLSRPIRHEPGTRFEYDDDSVNLLSVASGKGDPAELQELRGAKSVRPARHSEFRLESRCRRTSDWRIYVVTQRQGPGQTRSALSPARPLGT